MDADGEEVGDVTVTVKPAAAVSRVVRRDATTVASVSLEMPAVERSITPYLICGTVGDAPGTVHDV
jgi:hypothetical protein